MSYAAALYYLHTFILLPWKSNLNWTAPQASEYTLHGLKSTLIAWATQLNIPKEHRRLQGKRIAAQSSTRLYSRDDVFGALALQNSMHIRISEGWKPATQLARGGQLPLIEPSFKVECFSKPALKREWKVDISWPVGLNYILSFKAKRDNPYVSTQDVGRDGLLWILCDQKDQRCGPGCE